MRLLLPGPGEELRLLLPGPRGELTDADLYAGHGPVTMGKGW